MTYFFLYTELADYIMNCFTVHLEQYPEDTIHVVHYPVNKEAPFVFNQVERLHMHNKEELTDDQLHLLADNIQPDVIFCSGWADRAYNEIADGMKRKGTPVVLCFDNIYHGTLKQRFFLPIARVLFKMRYNAAWVPGKRQTIFAKKLHFYEDNIFSGFYATDTRIFQNVYELNRHAKKNKFPKIFLCVARYIPQKGLQYLWKAFIELNQEGHTDWELWCAGTGEGFDARMQHEKIKHLGFVQPSDFSKLIADSGVFVLPSLFEPWGVAVNEFAAAGMPLLLSSKVGSGEAYLHEGENGYFMQPGNVADIKAKMLKMMKHSDEELYSMGRKSHSLGIRINAEKWSRTLAEIGSRFSIAK